MTLDQLIYVKRKSGVTATPSGGLTAAVETRKRCFAKVKPMSGTERNSGDQNSARANYRFYIRRRADLQETDVIEWKGVDYNIRFIPDAGSRDRFTAVEAEKGVAIGL